MMKDNAVDTICPPKSTYSDLLGMNLVEWDVEHAVVEINVDERHLNTLGVAHGGVLLSALDNALGMCLTYREPPETRRYCVTINMTASFLAPVRKGRLTVTARRTAGGQSIAFCEAEAKDQSGRLVGTASGAFKMLRDSRGETTDRSA